MHLTGEICGAGIEARSEGHDVVVRIGDSAYSPAEIDALSVASADWTETVCLGGFVFDSAALAALKQFAAAADLAAQAERSSVPTA